MLRVIVNSTPIMSLGNIGRLDILRQMYGRIVIPEAVRQEILEKQDLASKAVLAADWIEVQSIADPAD